MIRTPLRRRTPLHPKTGLRPRRKTRPGRIPEAVLDALWSKVIRTRDKRCQNSACEGEWPYRLEAAHVISKTYGGTQWDVENGVALCARDHAVFHKNPILAGRFFEAYLGRETYDWLWAKAQAAGKVDRAAVKDYLKAQLAELEAKQ